jgi:hypothetical protein
MNIEKIHEPIRVLADCHAGELRPLRFRWSGRNYRIESINARWIDRRPDGYALHYSLQAAGQAWQVHFDSKEMQWWVDETIV